MLYSDNHIKEYYRSCENSYKDIWHLDECMAMHLGIWDEDVKTLPQALLKENEILARLGNIQPTDHVLDAGCGVGGSAIWLASHISCRATGITLAPNQVASAERNAQKHHVADLVDFKMADYLHTGFPDQSFDVVWAINSVCYAEPKMDFIAEAYRLLKPGGRLLISDAFQGKSSLTGEEHQLLYNQTYHGWVVNSLATPPVFLEEMQEVGFRNCLYVDQSAKTMRSVQRLYFYYFPAILYQLLSPLLGKRFSKIQKKNTTMLFHLYRSFKKGLWQYGMVYGIK